jgi:two-component system, OmpR family, phosphate regulon response regulator OmpR
VTLLVPASRHVASMSSEHIPGVAAAPRPGCFPALVVVADDDAATRALLAHTLRKGADRLRMPSDVRSPDAGGPDPDLIVWNAAIDHEAAHSVRSLHARWPSALLACINVASENDAVRHLNEGADVVAQGGVAPRFQRAMVAAAVRRRRLATARLRATFGDLTYDREKGRVWCGARLVHLTPCELRLFDCLFMLAGTDVSTDLLRESVGRRHDQRPTNIVAVYVSYLRRKLADSQTVRIRVVRGRGYCLTTEVFSDPAGRRGSSSLGSSSRPTPSDHRTAGAASRP